MRPLIRSSRSDRFAAIPVIRMNDAHDINDRSTITTFSGYVHRETDIPKSLVLGLPLCTLQRESLTSWL